MKLFLVLGLFISSVSLAAGVSASRKPNETWAQAKARTTSERTGQKFSKTPVDLAKDLSKINFAAVYDLKNNEDLMTIFQYVRDTRFMQNLYSPIQRRKLSWKFPDDGCFVRAELMARFIEEKRMPPTLKVFVFGDLAVRTNNAFGGIVRWWYHVAPAYRVGKNVYILDPSIEMRRPMTIQEWRERVSVESNVRKFALCSQHTFDPDDGCLTPQKLSNEYVMGQQQEFLNYEWERIVRMGKDPYAEL